MKNFLIFLLLLAMPAVAKGAYTARSDASQVGFTLRHFANKASGNFDRFGGTLNFEKSNPEASQVTFSVDVNSVDTANSERDEHLRNKDYFDTTTYPKMTFESKAFKKVGKDKYMVTGPLTIKGHSKNISVPVTLERSQTLWATGEEALTFQCQFTIDRTEFGVGEASSLLGSEVTIDLNLEFRREP